MRSSGRIPKELPILLIGDDLDGKVFSERTRTVVLSLHGAGILSKHKLCPEQELILRCPERNKETEVRVVGQLGTHDGIHTYGVAFVNPTLNFWDIEFPPISSIEREFGLLSLVCTSCKTLEKIDDTGIEADICATNEGVMRFCKRCGSSTLWKPDVNAFPQESVPPATEQMSLFSVPSSPASSSTAKSSAPPAPPPAPVPLPAAGAPSASFYAQSYASTQNSSASRTNVYPARPEPLGEQRTAILTVPQPQESERPRVNRRKHPRVKVNYSACVRHPQRGDDVVLCEDMSKGGLRFKSRKHYYAQSLIEVAAPYQPGQPAIFIPAQIVFVEELPEQQLFRYGVQYLKPTRIRDSF